MEGERGGRRLLRFWGSALAAAAVAAGGLAAAVPLVLRLEPREGLRLLGGVEVWLLATFTAGALAVLLGLSVGIGGWLRGSRFRGGLHARMGSGADEVRDGGDEGPGPPGAEPGEGEETGPDASWWTVAVGAWLLALYFAAWWALGAGP